MAVPSLVHIYPYNFCTAITAPLHAFLSHTHLHYAQAVGSPIVQAYMSVAPITNLYSDITANSGDLVGKFILDVVPFPVSGDEGGRQRGRQKRDIPTGLSLSRLGQACSYTTTAAMILKGLEDEKDKDKKKEKEEEEEEEEEIFLKGAFSVVWICPGPDLGDVVVVANIRRRNESKWTKLSYSLRESSKRCVH